MQAYYPQLEKIVLANLSTNISDLMEVDQHSLKYYQGAFLHAHNHDSTGLILLDEPKYLDWQVRDQAESDFFKNNNNTYLLGCEGNIRQISKKRAMQIWQGYSHLSNQPIRSQMATADRIQLAI
jgi:hypothetical protein